MNKRNKFLTKLALGGLGIGLLVFAASRTLEFVQATMPADKQYMGYLFLLATGIGALIWLAVFLNDADGFKQRALAFAMGLIDLGGEFVLVYADTMRTSSNNGLVKLAEGALQTFILASVAAIGLNALAWYLYKLWDPKAERESQARDLVDDVTEAAMKQLNTPEAKAQMIADYAPVLQAAVMSEVAMTVSQIAGQHRRILDSKLLPVDDSLHVPSNGYPLEVPAPSFFEKPREWLKNKFARNSTTSTQGPIQDLTKGQEVVWLEPEGPEGPRVRIYCLHCMNAGKLWRTPEPCEHVLNAKGMNIKPLSTGYVKDVESVSIPGADAGASTATGPASKPPTEGAGPEIDPALKANYKDLGMWNPNDPRDSPFERSRPDVHAALTAGAPDNYGPLWKSSTNITPTLDAYAWVCLKCDAHNPPHTSGCRSCGNPRTNGSPTTAFAT